MVYVSFVRVGDEVWRIAGVNPQGVLMVPSTPEEMEIYALRQRGAVELSFADLELVLLAGMSHG